MTINARILTDDQIEDAVLATLKLWIPSRLSEIESQLSISVGYYQRPVAWEVKTDFQKFPEEMLPMIIAVSIGLDDRPLKSGARRYRAVWNIGVIAIASSISQADSRRAAYRLGAAARAALIHRQSLDGALGGTVRGIEWIGSTNNEVPSDDGRTIWAQRQVFRVEVDDVVTMSAGPAGPDAEPPPGETPPPAGDWPTITDRSKIRTTIIPTEEPIT